jgi:membrane protease YdiL (CAAX protease family)
VVVTTVAGIVFALLRVWSRSIVAPVLAHWATNSLAYAAALLALDLAD